MRKHLLSCSVTHSTCRVQLELEPFAERGELLPMKMQLHLFSVLSYLHIFAKPVQIVELLGFYGNDDRRWEKQSAISPSFWSAISSQAALLQPMRSFWSKDAMIARISRRQGNIAGMLITVIAMPIIANEDPSWSHSATFLYGSQGNIQPTRWQWVDLLKNNN